MVTIRRGWCMPPWCCTLFRTGTATFNSAATSWLYVFACVCVFLRALSAWQTTNKLWEVEWVHSGSVVDCDDLLAAIWRVHSNNVVGHLHSLNGWSMFHSIEVHYVDLQSSRLWWPLSSGRRTTKTSWRTARWPITSSPGSTDFKWLLWW